MLIIHERIKLPFEIQSNARRRHEPERLSTPSNLETFETEMDRLEWIGRDVRWIRREMREHELFSNLRFLIVVGIVLAAWYFRAI